MEPKRRKNNKDNWHQGRRPEEQGIRSPDGATSKLLRILEAHPELIDD